MTRRVQDTGRAILRWPCGDALAGRPQQRSPVTSLPPPDHPAEPRRDADRHCLGLAVEQARIGWAEGGVPIGAALVHDGEGLAVGRNRRVQMVSAIRHGETDCLERAGRLPASVYRRSVLYTTLSPCYMCAGAALLYGIPRIVIGENRSFQQSEDLLRSRRVQLDQLPHPGSLQHTQRVVGGRQRVGGGGARGGTGPPPHRSE